MLVTKAVGVDRLMKKRGEIMDGGSRLMMGTLGEEEMEEEDQQHLRTFHELSDERCT